MGGVNEGKVFWFKLSKRGRVKRGGGKRGGGARVNWGSGFNLS